MATPDDDFRPDVSVLLVGLGALALGAVGLAAGRAVVVLPVDASGGASVPAWAVGRPGETVAAVGLLAVGAGCVGFWWRGYRARWAVPLAVVGVLLVAAGSLAGWLGSL